VVLGDVIAKKTLGNSLFESSGPTQDLSIKEFLAKPVIIQQGVLANTDTATTFPYMELPRTAISALVAEKLRGFYGFTATSVLTIQINGNPFQSGRYMLYYIPMGGVRNNSTQADDFAIMHENTKRQRTQLPRIEIDVNCDTQGQLRVPYVSAYSFYPLVAATSGVPIGTVARARLAPYVEVYTPSGSNTVPYTIWHHFEDVNLIGAAIPQMGTYSETEAKGRGLGPLQSASVSVSKTMGLLNAVPLLSEYTRPLGWIADMVTGVASAYGWSKPLDQAPVIRSLRTTVPYMANVNTADPGYNLGAFSSNEVSVLPGFAGTDLDEMSIASIATRPSYIDQFAWLTSTPAGTVIATYRCCPQPVAATRIVGGLVGVQDHTPASFSATLFEYWRGSVIFDFKMVKTKFHSGRLLVTFSPSVWFIGATLSTMTTSAYEWRTIIDVREESTFRIQVPYLSAEQYLPTEQETTLSLQHFGTIQIMVLDPLVAPASVGASIAIMVEHSMGPDVEFAVPATCNMLPVVGATPQMNMGGDPCEVYSGIIGNAVVKSDDGFNAAACMGERVSSFRQLIKSMNLLQDLTHPFSTAAINIVPFGIQTLVAGTSPVLPVHTGDLYSVLASCFVFTRGSVRFKTVNPSNVSQWPMTAALRQASSNGYNVPAAGEESVVSKTANDFTGTVGGSLGILNQTGFSFHNVNANMSTEITVPNYSQYHSRASADHIMGRTLAYNNDGYSIANRSRVTLSYPQGNNFVSTVWRGGGDDLNFSGFISIPPIYRVTSQFTP
jgi:hypothetical protein